MHICKTSIANKFDRPGSVGRIYLLDHFLVNFRLIVLIIKLGNDDIKSLNPIFSRVFLVGEVALIICCLGWTIDNREASDF